MYVSKCYGIFESHPNPSNPKLVIPDDIVVSQWGKSESGMRLLHSLLSKLGLAAVRAERHPIRVFLLDDDESRHKWFRTRFKGDFLDIAENVVEAQQMLGTASYDAIFLDHDLHPEHYHAESTDDERTGYAVALWLSTNPDVQRASTILVHTRNADGAMRMVEELRRAGRSAEYVPFPLLAERIKSYWQR
jgi:Cyclic-phosphate processing Receiver domain